MAGRWSLLLTRRLSSTDPGPLGEVAPRGNLPVMDEAVGPEIASSEVPEIINFRQMAKATEQPSTRCQIYEVLARIEGPTPQKVE